MDTNAISEVPKQRPRRSVLAFVESCSPDQLSQSTVSLAEMEFGALIATALEHNLTLVTRNTRDFAGISNLALLDPWAGPATPDSL